MDDYALVLNAGSSSLKFCVFQRPSGQGWRLEARGQIEGIGTSPRLSAKGADGQSLANQDVPVRDGRQAVDSLAGWLKSRYAGSRVVGVPWPSAMRAWLTTRAAPLRVCANRSNRATSSGPGSWSRSRTPALIWSTSSRASIRK